MTIIPNKQNKTSDIYFDPKRLQAANINPISYLATDYLNHFNETIMLIEILSDMPDMADEVLNWQPVSYERHFEESGFIEKDLAITAYTHSPPALRKKFDDVVADIDQHIIEIQTTIRSAMPHLTPQLYQNLHVFVAQELRPRIDKASAIIRGEDESHNIPPKREPGSIQKAIDELFACSKDNIKGE